MDMANCKKCSKIFVKVKSDLCPDCIKKEEEELNKVQKYLRNNPNVSVSVASEATGIDESTILKFIDRGRIKVSRSAAFKSGLVCSNCGAEILSGSLCRVCSGELLKQKKMDSINKELDARKGLLQKNIMHTKRDK